MKQFLFCISLFFVFSSTSAQTLETKLEGNMVEVRVSRGLEAVTTRQIYISESPLGDSVRRNFIDHGKYINSIQGIVTKEAVPVALNTAPFVAGSLPEGKKLYVNAVLASQTQPGILFWVNTQGGAVITPTKEVRFAINLNPLVVKDDKISLSGVIDTKIHWDYKDDKFKLTYYLTDAGDIRNPITTLHTQAVPIAPNGSFQVSNFGIATLDSSKIYTVVLKVTSPSGNVDDKSFIQKFSKDKGFILPVTTEAGREAFDAQTYRLLAPLPGLSLIRDTDLCLEYKASLKAQGQDTENIVCDINDFLNFLMRMLIAISAIFLIVRIVIAGFSYMVTDIPFVKASSKGAIGTALAGLALALGAWVLLNTINPRLVSGGVELGQVNFEVINYPDVGDNTIDPDFKTGQRKFSQDATVSPNVVRAVEKLKNGWEIDYFRVFQNNRMLIALKKGGEKDISHLIDIAPGLGGYAPNGTARTGDNKTPIGTWKIIDIRYTEGKAQFSGKGSNMGAAFWHLSPMTTGERGIGIHGNKKGTLSLTNGCIRLKNSDIIALQPYVKKGLLVIVK